MGTGKVLCLLRFGAEVSSQPARAMAPLTPTNLPTLGRQLLAPVGACLVPLPSVCVCVLELRVTDARVACELPGSDDGRVRLGDAARLLWLSGPGVGGVDRAPRKSFPG